MKRSLKQERQQQPAWMVAGAKQMLRYGFVGLINSSIDFAFTNLFVIATGASTAPGLFFASLFACLIATVNGFFLNQRWTFKSSIGQLPRYAMAKYFAVAFLAMLVNTSTFLFVFHYLTIEFRISRMLGINLAKLVGVAMGAMVAFLGFRITIFRPTSIIHFRQTFSFGHLKSRVSLFQQTLLVTLFAALVRAGYLFLTTSIYGDAVNYGWLARYISEGHFERVQGGWVNLYAYWEALFYLLGFGPIASAIAASYLPGVFLLIPVMWVARCLYGEQAAWLAGVITALHPRLVEFSANGYPEMFYLLFFTFAVAFFTFSMQGPVHLGLVGVSGLCMGLFFVVRSEALITAVFLLAGALVIAWRAKKKKEAMQAQTLWIKAPLLSSFVFSLGFCLAVGGWLFLTELTLGQSVVFKQSSMVLKQYSEQLDPRKSAQEVYGRQGAYFTGKWSDRSIGEQLFILLKRFPRNFIHMLRAMPGILLTPLCFFALLFPVFCRSLPPRLFPEWALLTMLIVPLLLYPLLQIEPRYFIPTLIPIHIFGAATLIALGYFTQEALGTNKLFSAVIVLTILLCIFVTLWRGVELEKRYRHHRKLASWIKEHVGPKERIVGGGYGFVSTTGFLAERETINRIWTHNPARLTGFVRDQNSRWLILYEGFIQKVNPELIKVLDEGMPAMEKVYETRDYLNQRVQIYRAKQEN